MHESNLVPLYDDETVEDLQRAGLRIIQKKDGFRFGEDAVILAHAAGRLWNRARQGPLHFAELGSHCGVVSILLACLQEDSAGIGLEISPRQVEVMKRNLVLNHLEDRLKTLCLDVRQLAGPTVVWPDDLAPGMFDMVIANPPYGLPGREIIQAPSTAAEKERLIARYELTLTFPEVARASARLLRHKGRLVIVHRPDRLPELLLALHENGLAPTELIPVTPHMGEAPSIIILCARKGGRDGGFSLKASLTVRAADGSYSRQLESVYGHPEPLSGEDLLKGLYAAGPPPPPADGLTE